jgi:hypothetical protein
MRIGIQIGEWGYLSAQLRGTSDFEVRSADNLVCRAGHRAGKNKLVCTDTAELPALLADGSPQWLTWQKGKSCVPPP